MCGWVWVCVCVLCVVCCVLLLLLCVCRSRIAASHGAKVALVECASGGSKKENGFGGLGLGLGVSLARSAYRGLRLYRERA